MNTIEYFNYDKAVDACRELSVSQGFYGKVLETLLELDELQIQKFNDEMNTNNIYDIVDFVMYIEQ